MVKAPFAMARKCKKSCFKGLFCLINSLKRGSCVHHLNTESHMHTIPNASALCFVLKEKRA